MKDLTNARFYRAKLVDTDKGTGVIDGDTIKNVHIAVRSFLYKLSDAPKEVFPGLVVDGNTLYRVANVQIADIDAPERKPITKDRSDESRERERTAAEAAANALDDMLSANDYKFWVANPEEGSFGRIIADVLVDSKSNVGERLIGLGHAKPIGEGWDWDSD